MGARSQKELRFNVKDVARAVKNALDANNHSSTTYVSIDNSNCSSGITYDTMETKEKNASHTFRYKPVKVLTTIHGC